MKINYQLLTIVLIFVSLSISAQTSLKIGHVNIQDLVQKHPDSDSIRQVLEAETGEMEKIYMEMITEQDTKLKTFEKEQSGYSEFARKTKENELAEMTQKIQMYNQTAQQQLQRRNMELLQPVYEQINSSIKKIADGNSFTYILDISNGAVAYVATDSQNITPLVMEELGITSQNN